MADVFVSYSRRDSDFVRRLVASIEERGKSVWWIPRDRRWGGVPEGLAAGNRGVRCVLVRDHAGVGRVALLRAADRARADVGEADPPGAAHQGARRRAARGGAGPQLDPVRSRRRVQRLDRSRAPEIAHYAPRSSGRAGGIAAVLIRP